MTDSRSTDKLALLVQGLGMLPKETLLNVESFYLTWECLQGTLVPKLCVVFKQ